MRRIKTSVVSERSCGCIHCLRGRREGPSTDTFHFSVKKKKKKKEENIIKITERH